MTPKDLIVHLDSGTRAAERLEFAVALARRQGARLTGLFAESVFIGRSLVGKRSPDAVEGAAREARHRFEAKVGAAGVPARFWRIAPGEYSDVVGATVVCCRHADMAVLGQQEGDDAPVPEGMVERVIADAGRPVLVVPSVGTYREVGRRALVAWTGSRESARALHDALPLLAQAEEVTVLSLQLPKGPVPGGLPPLDLAAHLRAHGIAATYERAILAEVAAVDVVLNRASDLGADLTVMGAYGVRGGGALRSEETTRAILATMTTPVLLAS